MVGVGDPIAFWSVLGRLAVWAMCWQRSGKVDFPVQGMFLAVVADLIKSPPGQCRSGEDGLAGDAGQGWNPAIPTA
jgi:hypothetical protein